VLFGSRWARERATAYEEEQMKRSRVMLGTTDMEISRVGFGAWALGGGEWQGGWGSQDDADSVAAIHHAIDLGVNWIDTAPAYGLGRSEEIVGAAVQQIPAADRPLIFTKCGLVWQPGERSVSNSLAPGSIRRECEESLRRLQVEAIDLLQAHWPTWDETSIEESWATMSDLVDEGKVRYIGLSNYDHDAITRCEQQRHVDTFQPELNLLVREVAAQMLPWCIEHSTGVIVYSPMRSGLLTGRFSAERVAALPDDDWRATNEDFTSPQLERNLALVDRLRAIADRLSVSLPELSVAWAASWPGVDGAIVGARRPEQIDEWIGAAELRLGDKDMDDIAIALQETGAGKGPVMPPRVPA
jgi:aryl-alcohol dehydrogenase-like predicted oxidoreductase